MRRSVHVRIRTFALCAALVGVVLPAAAQQSSFPFGAGETILVDVGSGPGTKTIALADLNGDGRADLVVLNRLQLSVAVFLALADGSFAEPDDYLVEADGIELEPAAVAVGDVGSPFASPSAGAPDGNPDLVVAAEDYLVIFAGNGQGGFERREETLDFLFFPVAITLGDFDGNGTLDVAVLEDFDEIDVALNQAGIFDPDLVEFYDTGGDFAVDIEQGDVDGDGVLDLVVISSDDQSLSLFIGGGGGAFGEPQLFSTLADQAEPDQTPTDVALADLNGDGADEAVVVNFGEFSDLQILIRYGPNLFASTAVSGPFAANAIVMADFDEDALLDAAITSESDGTVILAGNGSGLSALGGVVVPALGTGRAIAAGQFAQSSYADLVVLDPDGFQIATAINLLPLPTPTSSPTGTVTPTATPTGTATDTPTITPTASETETETVTPTATPSGTAADTATATATPSETPTGPPTPTPTASGTAVDTPTSTPTPSDTPTGSLTATPTPSATAMDSPTSTPSPSETPAGSFTPTPTRTETVTGSPTPTASETSVATVTVTITPSVMQTPTATPTSTASETATVAPPPTATATGSESSTPTATNVSSATPTTTPTRADTSTPTATASATVSASTSPSATPTRHGDPDRSDSDGCNLGHASGRRRAAFPLLPVILVLLLRRRRS